MAISDNDYKILWGRAAGICSNPSCRADLTVVVGQGGYFNVGEMAHIIARSEDGPRGVPGGGVDDYGNLILLCPTCHRKIDKAPDGEFPVELLHKWKNDHELAIRGIGRERIFSNLDELKLYVSRLLIENRMLWKTLGPHSETADSDPGSNLHVLWTLRKLDIIIPNNNKIINSIDANIHLLRKIEIDAFINFKIHATAFEANQIGRLDSYPTFPMRFAELFEI